MEPLWKYPEPAWQHLNGEGGLQADDSRLQLWGFHIEEENKEDSTAARAQNAQIAASTSGQVDIPPFSIGESIMERLQVGMTPLQDRILYDDLKKLIEETMKSYVQEYHIGIPQSAEAFLIPGIYCA